MSDYIKREPRTFIEIADDLNDLVSELNDKIVELIREKNADVAPVRRGRWIEDKSRTEEIYTHPVKCSACGQTEVLEYGTITAYCPNCGAKMDEEE